MSAPNGGELVRLRVLLADDHVPFLEAVSAILHPQFEIIGKVTTGGGLVSEAQRLHPDVIVCDINMPGTNGIDAIRQLRQSGSTATFVCLTVYSDEEMVNACLAAGAKAYVWKSCLKTHLIPAIHATCTGASYISPLTPEFAQPGNSG